MKIIAVTAAGGGAGITTVAAHLAAALTTHDSRSIAIDASPRNALRLHFGMAWEDATGLASNVISGLPWNEAAFRSSSGIDFVPLGRASAAVDFDKWLSGHPGWFKAKIAEIDQSEGDFAVCDCPASGSNLSSQILAEADLAIVVLTPDALSYATAETTMRDARSAGAREAAFLLNRFDSTHMLDRDIESLMISDFKDSFLPVLIHNDESVREAFANKQTVFEYAPSCQATSDFSALAMWLIARFPANQEYAA